MVPLYLLDKSYMKVLTLRKIYPGQKATIELFSRLGEAYTGQRFCYLLNTREQLDRDSVWSIHMRMDSSLASKFSQKGLICYKILALHTVDGPAIPIAQLNY
jgi:hypothetical protein